MTSHDATGDITFLTAIIELPISWAYLNAIRALLMVISAFK